MPSFATSWKPHPEKCRRVQGVLSASMRCSPVWSIHCQAGCNATPRELVSWTQCRWGRESASPLTPAGDRSRNSAEIQAPRRHPRRPTTLPRRPKFAAQVEGPVERQHQNGISSTNVVGKSNEVFSPFGRKSGQMRQPRAHQYTQGSIPRMSVTARETTYTSRECTAQVRGSKNTPSRIETLHRPPPGRGVSRTPASEWNL